MAAKSLEMKGERALPVDALAQTLWWDADTAEDVAAAICFAEFRAPPPGETQENYWRGVAPPHKAVYRRMAGAALQAAAKRVWALRLADSLNQFTD